MLLECVKSNIPSHPMLNPMPDYTSDVNEAIILLSGPDWKLNRNAEEKFPEKDWKEISIPAQPALYPLQEKYAYRKVLVIPEEWENRQIFLRFDGANGVAKIYIDGCFVKEHYGAFVSWDCEITGFVKSGESHQLVVVMEDRVREMGDFNYGGLIRDVFIYALAETHLTRFHYDTVFDTEYNNAELTVHFGVSEKPDEIHLKLKAPDGKQLELDRIIPVDTEEFDVSLWVECPLKWDCEHPNLYLLTVDVLCGNKVVETVSRRIGFRQIERRGNTVYVNGEKVKLHGVNRHDTYPLTDRVVTHELVEQDVKLFKEANINFIRTSHYPPRTDFLDLCDTYGIYVEDEASICFLGYASRQVQSDPEFKELFLQNFSEMIERDYSHPCILIWSLSNESHWGTNFPQLNEYAHAVDKQRQTIFSFPINQFDDDEQTDIFSVHYAAFDSDFAARQDALGRSMGMPADTPVLHDECTHVPLLDAQGIRREPGIRDFWGEGIDPFWQKVWNTDGVLGAAIWAGIDNTVVQEDRMRGPSWGLVDGWRRKKPEYWHVRKAYSPVRLLGDPYMDDGKISVDIKNRFLHTNLKEILIVWKTQESSGCIYGPDVLPFADSKITLPVSYRKGQKLELTFTDAWGNQVDEGAFVIGGEEVELPELSGKRPVVREEEKVIRVIGESCELTFSKETGLIVDGRKNGQIVICGGPYLHLTGLHLGEWELDSLKVEKEDNVSVILTGHYDKVKVEFTIRIDGDGMMQTDFEILNMPYCSPRRIAQTSSICASMGGYDEVGIAYIVPKEMEKLTWKRKGYWNVYPEWHIGRLEGSASKRYPGGVNDDIIPPDREWRFDEKDTAVYTEKDICERGTRDFASMKFHIYEASIGNADKAFQVCSDGTDSVRMLPLIKKENVIVSQDPAICYTGNWFDLDTKHRSYSSVEMTSKSAGDTCELSFVGTGIAWFSSLDTICGTANVYIDGQLLQEELDLGTSAAGKNVRNYAKYYQYNVFAVQNLDNREHTIKIEVTGEKARDSYNSYVNIDYFAILDENPLGETKVIINKDYNYTQLSWGNWEKEAVLVDTGYKGTVYTKLR